MFLWLLGVLMSMGYSSEGNAAVVMGGDDDGSEREVVSVITGDSGRRCFC